MIATATPLVAPVMAKTKRNDRPAKIDAEVLRMAAIVAAYRDSSVAEYLSELLRPLVARDLREHQTQGGQASSDTKPEGRRRKP